MRFATIATFAFAAATYAIPVENTVREVSVSLPAGCTEKDLAECALHLVGTTASCGAAVLEIGLNVVADLSCVGSAASTAINIDECKSCIPDDIKVEEK